MKVCGLDISSVVKSRRPSIVASSIGPSSPIDLPSFPVLTSLHISLGLEDPPRRLVEILCAISSAPELSTVSIIRPWNGIETASRDAWVGVDRWLARAAGNAKVEGDLSLTLEQWPSDKVVWDGFLSRFIEAGGKIGTNPGEL